MPQPNQDTVQQAKPHSRLSQPLDVIGVDGALLKLSTVGAIAGDSLSTLYRAIAAGELEVVKRGARCTRVPAEAARKYLAQRRGVTP